MNAPLSSYNKTIVSIVMGILVILDQKFDFRAGLGSSETATTVLAVIWAILVWIVPNHDGT